MHKKKSITSLVIENLLKIQIFTLINETSRFFRLQRQYESITGFVALVLGFLCTDTEKVLSDSLKKIV